MLMILDEGFLQRNIEIRNILLRERDGPLVDARLAQEGTIQRTIDGNFASRAAALRANIAVDTRAVPARTPLFTELTKGTHASSLSPGARDIPSMTVGALPDLQNPGREGGDLLTIWLGEATRDISIVTSAYRRIGTCRGPIFI